MQSMKISLDKFIGIASIAAILATLASYYPAPPLLLALAILGFLMLYLCVGLSDRGLSVFAFFVGTALALIAQMGGAP